MSESNHNLNNVNHPMNGASEGAVNVENVVSTLADGEVKEDGRLGQEIHEESGKEKDDNKVSDGGTNP